MLGVVVTILVIRIGCNRGVVLLLLCVRLDLLQSHLLEDLEWNGVVKEECAQMRFMVTLVFRFSDLDRLLNINSLLNKVDYVSIFAKDCDLGVVAVSEGWLIESILSSFVTVEEYNIIRGIWLLLL